MKISRHSSASFKNQKKTNKQTKKKTNNPLPQQIVIKAGALAPDIICIPGMSIQVPENCRPVGKWCAL